jgi:predicted metal-dependent hydrolase
MATHHIQYGKKRIEFDVIYSDRKSLGITVHPDKSVLVRAPVNSNYQKILDKVRNRSRWILKQQDHFESFLPATPPRKYVSGETHLYLGKQYRLKLYESNQEKVKMIRGYLQVFTKDRNNKEKIKTMLDKWYRRHFDKKIDERLNVCFDLFKNYDIQKPDILVRRMKNRWGSCTTQGKIILNPDILKAPSRSIDYVIIHELCHLVHPTHSKQFYALQSRMMPDWEKWKRRLEEMLV